MKFSIIIPAYNEEGSIRETVTEIYNTLIDENIDHEIVVVNDNSTDNTQKMLQQLANRIYTKVTNTD